MENEFNDVEFERNLKFQRSVFSVSSTLAILICYGILSTLLLVMFGIDNINPWVLGLSEVLFLLVPSILIIKPLKYKFNEIFKFSRPKLIILLLAIGGFICFELLTQGYLSIQKYLIPDSWMKVYDTMINNYVATIEKLIGRDNLLILSRSILIIAIIPAISEEFLFRGFLQTTLQRNSGPVIAITISSVLFGAMHLNLGMFIPLPLAGAYFGYVGFVTSNLIYPVILHFLTNLISVLTVYFQNDMTSNSSTETVTLKLGIIFFCLGIAGVIAVSYYLYKLMPNPKMSPQPESLNNG